MFGIFLQTNPIQNRKTWLKTNFDSFYNFQTACVTLNEDQMGAVYFVVIRVFRKLSAIPECQYCQLYFSCAIRNEQDQWSLQTRNINLLYPLTSNFTFTNIIWSKQWRKLQIYFNTKLAIMPILEFLWVCEKLDCPICAVKNILSHMVMVNLLENFHKVGKVCAFFLH